MTNDLVKITQSVRDLMLEGVLAGEDPEALQDSTPLITGGVIDSVRMVTLIGDLEDRFGVAFEAFEMSVDHLDTIEIIAATVQKKTQG